MSKKKQRKSKTSSGNRKLCKLNQLCRQLQGKINRWDRYRSEIEQGLRDGDPSRWDTSGLQKHLALVRG